MHYFYLSFDIQYSLWIHKVEGGVMENYKVAEILINKNWTQPNGLIWGLS